MRLNSSVFVLFDTLDPLVSVIRYDQRHENCQKISFSKKVLIKKLLDFKAVLKLLMVDFKKAGFLKLLSNTQCNTNCFCF